MAFLFSISVAVMLSAGFWPKRSGNLSIWWSGCCGRKGLLTQCVPELPQLPQQPHIAPGSFSQVSGTATASAFCFPKELGLTHSTSLLPWLLLFGTSSLRFFFFFPLKIPWVNILCRTCWHFFWSKFPWCFVEESGIFLYSDSFKIKDGLSGLAGLQTQFDPNPLFFPNFSSLFYCLCIFYCSSTSELEDFWECFMQSLVAPAVTGPKRKSWRPKISFCDILWGYFANYIKNSWARSGFGNFILTVLSYFFQNF